jgi:hypothetical protein
MVCDLRHITENPARRGQEGREDEAEAREGFRKKVLSPIQ